MLGFVFGALAGAVAATYWHRDLSNFREQHLPRLRSQTAEKLEAAERAIVGAVSKASTEARSRLRPEDRPRSDRVAGPR